MYFGDVHSGIAKYLVCLIPQKGDRNPTGISVQEKCSVSYKYHVNKTCSLSHKTSGVLIVYGISCIGGKGPLQKSYMSGPL